MTEMSKASGAVKQRACNAHMHTTDDGMLNNLIKKNYFQMCFFLTILSLYHSFCDAV